MTRSQTLTYGIVLLAIGIGLGLIVIGGLGVASPIPMPPVSSPNVARMVYSAICHFLEGVNCDDMARTQIDSMQKGDELLL